MATPEEEEKPGILDLARKSGLTTGMEPTAPEAPFVPAPGSFSELAGQANAANPPPVAAGPTASPPVVTAPPPATVQAPEQPFTPPGPQTVSTRDAHTTITGGTPVNKALQTQMHELKSAKDGGEQNLIQKEAEIKATAQEQIAKAEQERANKLAIERTVQENAAEQRRLEAAQHLKEIRAAQKEVDEHKAPPEDSLGTTIGKAIALGLGAFGSGLTGGPNQAMQVIEADKAAKLNAWKAQYARMKDKVSGKENLYALFRQKGLDDQTAEAATIQNLNNGYQATIKQIEAGSKAPETLANAKLASNKIQQETVALDTHLDQLAHAHVSRTVDEKTVTKDGGANTEEKGKLLEQANKDEHISKYREVSGALARFQDLRAGGADGAALSEFIAGKGGLGQGSYTPTTMMEALKKRGLIGKTVEELRSLFAGGVPPDLMKEIGNGLAASVHTTRAKAEPAIKYFQREFNRAGIDPRMVAGGETSTEAASAAGAAPSAYQGRQ